MRRFFTNLTGDLRFATRQLTKQKGFAFTVVSVLALGIGSSTAVFSVLYQVLLKPLAYPHAERLVFVHNSFPKSQVAMAGVSGFDYAEVKRHRDLFSEAGVFYWNDLTLTGHGDAKHLDVVDASPSLFRALGVRAKLGRTFLEEEARYGAPGTAILSDRLWRSDFEADPHVVGRTIYLNGSPFSVVGVMPPAFQFPSVETQLWIPVALRPGEFTFEGGRMEKWLHMMARLRPGVSMKQASAGLQAISANLGARLPSFYPRKDGWQFAAKQIGDEQTSSIRPWLYLAFGGVLSVLLIACVNVSGFLLIRGTARTAEIAVRRALGASARRIVEQILTETGLLALFGCGFGLLLSFSAVDLINRYGPLTQPVAVRAESLLFALGVALVSTVISGLVPARQIAGSPVEQAAKSGSTRTATKDGGLRYALVAAQIAFAVGLTFTAIQLNRSFLNLTRVPAGFEQAHIWTGALTLPSGHYTASQSWNTRFFEPLLKRLADIPGVQSASSGNALPFNPSGVWTEALRLPGHAKTIPPPEAQIGLVFPRYFETMGIPLRRGRTFTEHDRDGVPPAAVIDEELARRYFPGENPLGKSIASGGAATPARIVGVVGSVHNNDMGGPRHPEVYYPELQERTEATYLVLRTIGDVDPTAAVRRVIAALDPDVALFDVQTMQDRVEKSLNIRRFIAFLLNGSAFIGLVLAIAGLYASLAHVIELRRREIGIRIAIGATQSQIVRMILARATIIVAGGLLAGSAGAIAAGQAIRTQLFGVKITDASTWIGVLGLVLIASVLVTWFPAWRAARIEPAVALRSE
jgi:predicted permease